MGHVPPPLPPADDPFDDMIADGDCPKCGGPIGSHSDICLHCGYRGDGESAMAGCMLSMLTVVAVTLIGWCVYGLVRLGFILFGAM